MQVKEAQELAGTLYWVERKTRQGNWTRIEAWGSRDLAERAAVVYSERYRLGLRVREEGVDGLEG